jgi:hypothetical protein
VLLAGACAPKEKRSESAEPPASPLQGKLLKQWMIGLANRQPSPGATMARTLGYGALGVSLQENGIGWYEIADVDSNGTQEKIGFMWDAKNKVMYAYTQDPVTLSDGTLADKGLLISQFGDGNTRGRVHGSGWYAYALQRDSTSDGSKGIIHGCTFDNTGAILECGIGKFERDGVDFKIKDAAIAARRNTSGRPSETGAPLFLNG